MRTAVVGLLAVAMIAAPLIPSVGAQTSPPPQGPATAAYEGDHVGALVDAELPGVANVTLAANGERVLDAVRFAGDEGFRWDTRDDELRVSTDSGAELRVEDTDDVPARLIAGDDGPLALEASDNVSLEERDDGFALLPDEAPGLFVAGNVTQDGRTLLVEGEAAWTTTTAAENATQAPDDEDQDAPANDTAEDERRGAPDEEDDGTRDAERNRSAARGDSDGDPTGAHRVGPVAFTLEEERLRNVSVREKPVFERVEVPGLTDVSTHRAGPHLSIVGQDAQVRLAADTGLLVRIQADEPVELRVAEDVDLDAEDGVAVIDAGRVMLVAQGPGLEVDEDRLTADGELRLTGKVAPESARASTWEKPRSFDHLGSAELVLPETYEGRFLGFTVTEAGIENLTVHGTPLGSVLFGPDAVDHVRRAGAAVHVDGPGFQVRGVDAPATQLTVQADNVTADLPDELRLASGATVNVTTTDDRVRVHVDRPRDAVPNRTVAQHRAPAGGVEPTEGPGKGLAARGQDGTLGVTSAEPSRLRTSFDGAVNGTEGNVSLDLSLERALLVEDANGNGKVDVGDPAVAERPLRNGTTTVQGDALVNRFELWSGTLDVIVEPGEDTAKITYEVTNLSAPPGTLFVLETDVQAPANATLTPTANGVVVENGTLSAEYSATGPVTVDGTEAWADRSIFVDSEDQVRVLLAYPAGDNITHDPTVAVQSSAAEVVAGIAASPYAIAIGAAGAVGLVAVTAVVKRRSRP